MSDTCFFVDYIPLYWQACKDASPRRSGVLTFALSTSVGPVAIISGLTIAYFKKYRPQCYISWAVYIIGCGLMSTAHADSPIGPTMFYSVLTTAGGGAIFSIADFPVLAPLPVSDNGRALTFFMFARTFAAVS